MARYEIIEARYEHIQPLALNLRYADVAEIHEAGFSTVRAIGGSFRRSLYRRTAFVNGEIAAMWGVGGVLTIGEAWLLTTPAIEKAPWAFAREGKHEVANMLKLFYRLQLMVHCDYTAAIRLASLWGFRPVGGSKFLIMER